MSSWRFALVMGGGGMRGLAHVGVLRALLERGWEPAQVIGTSIGALVGAAWAAGFTQSEMEGLALGIRRRDIFMIAHADMALKRMRSSALYRREPLENLVRGLLGDVTFRELPRRLVVECVEINSGMQIFWGAPGLDEVRVADAVIASCALPGFFPPREVAGRWCVDGALVDNLPVRHAATGSHDAVLGVDVGSTGVLRSETHLAGFAAIFARATEIVFQQASEWHLKFWTRPPLLLIQPRVEHLPMFTFEHSRELIDEGERAARQALDLGGGAVRAGRGGVHPRRLMQVRVSPERCIGCGNCVSLAPAGMFRMVDGKAVGPDEPSEWSPMDGGFIRHCPTYAITARAVLEPGPEAGASTAGASTGTGRGSA